MCRALPILHLHCPFATVLPICTCITIICTCLTHHLHLHYPFALELPICTCITHYLHLHCPLFALALPICTCITHLHLNYPFALALPICTCITHLHLHYPFVIFCITHYPSIAGINNAHDNNSPDDSGCGESDIYTNTLLTCYNQPK